MSDIVRYDSFIDTVFRKSSCNGWNCVYDTSNFRTSQCQLAEGFYFDTRCNFSSLTLNTVLNYKCDSFFPKESPEKSIVVATTVSKKVETSKSKSANKKHSSPVESTSRSEEKGTVTKKRKVEKSESPKPDTSSRKKTESYSSRKRKAEADSNDDEKYVPKSLSPEKKKTNGESGAKRKSEASKKYKSSISATIAELFENAPVSQKSESKESNVSKTFSKEERSKRLRILANSRSSETEKLLGQLSPKMAEKFVRLLNKEKETLKTSPVVEVDADGETEEYEVKSRSPLRKSEPLPLDDDENDVEDAGDVDCVIVSSPQPADVEKLKSPPKLSVEPFEEYDPVEYLPELEE